MTITFHSKWTADEIEDRDTEENPLSFKAPANLIVKIGDGAIVESKDGSSFIGRVDDVEYDRVFVVLR